MRIKQSNLWKNDDVRENVEQLRKAGGPINEEIISYCDYGSKCEAGLHSFLEREFSSINLEFNPDNGSDKANINKFFEEKGINYYTLKEFILKVFDESFPIEKAEGPESEK